MDALHPPPVALIELVISLRPAVAPAPCAQQSGVVVTEDHRLIRAPAAEAQAAQIAASAVPGARGKEATILHRSPRLQDLAARTFPDVVSGVITVAAHRHGLLIGSALGGMIVSKQRSSSRPKTLAYA